MPKTLFLLCLVLAEFILMAGIVNADVAVAPVQVRTRELKMTGVTETMRKDAPRADSSAPVHLTTKPLTMTGTRN